MKRLLVGLVAALAATTLSVPTSADAAAERPAPKPVLALAKKAKCKFPETVSFYGYPKHLGVECRYRGALGRQTVYILKFKNVARAIDYFRMEAEETEYAVAGCFVRRGKVLILPTGGGSGEDSYFYKQKWCDYFSKRTGGRIIYGYPL